MNNNLDSKLQRTMEQAPARLSKASLKALNSTAEKAPSTRPAAINRPATTQFLNTIAHEQDEVGEALARSINRVNQSLSQASHIPDSEQAPVDSQAKSMAVYTRLAGKLIDRDQGLQEKVAHNLSEPTRPVKTRDAAHSLQQAMAQLPERLQEGTSSGKELAKFMVQNLVQLANTKNMGAGLERDLAMRQINVPHHPVNARQQQASSKVLAASINYIKQNQPEVLAKVSTQEPPQQATTSPQPASSPNHERHAVTSAEIEGKTYLDIFKQRSAQSAQQAQSFHPQGRGVPYDEMSAEISQRIHELITKAASNAKSGNLIKLSPEEAANFDRTVSAARERAQGLDPNNTRLQSMLDSGTSTQQPSKVGQGPDGVLPPEHKAHAEPVRGLSLSELSARAAKLQQQFRDERQRIVSEGKLPNPAPLPETTFAAPKVTTEPSHSERQQALNHVESNTRELRAALAQAKAALAARIAQGATNTIEQDGTTQPTKAEAAPKSELSTTKPEPALSKADAKPAEAKPTEVKPAEVKPATAETTTKPTADLAKAETPVKSEAPAKPEVAAKPAPETASKALDLSLLKNTSLNVSYQAVQSTLYGDLDVIPGMTIPVSHFGDLQNEVITPNDKAIEVLKAQARVLAAQQQAQANSNLTELVSSAPKQPASTPAQPAPQPTQSTQPAAQPAPQVVTSGPQQAATQVAEQAQATAQQTPAQPAQTGTQSAQPASQVVTSGPQQAAAQVAEQAQATAQQTPAQPAQTGTQSAQAAPQVVTSGPQQAAAQVAEQAQAAAQPAQAQAQPAQTGTQSAQQAPQVVTSGPQQAAAQVAEQAQAAAQQTPAQTQPAPTGTQSAQSAPQVVSSGPQQAAAQVAEQAQAAAQQAQAQTQPAPTGTQSTQTAPQVVTSGPQQAAAEIAAQAQAAAQQAQAQAQPASTGTQSAQQAPQVVTSGPQQAAAQVAEQAQAAAQQAQAQTQPAQTGTQSAQAAPQVVTSGPQQAAAEIAAQAQAAAQQAQAQTQPAPTGTQSAPQVVTSGPQQAAAEIAAQAQAAAQQAQAQTQPVQTGTQPAQTAPQVVTSGPQQAAAEIAAQAQAAAQQAQAQTQPAHTGTQPAQTAPQVVTSGPQQAAAEIAAQAQAAAQQAQAQTQPTSTGTQSAQAAPQVVTSGPQKAAAEIAAQAQAAAQQAQAQTQPAKTSTQSAQAAPQVVTSGPQQAAAEIAAQAQAAAQQAQAQPAPNVPQSEPQVVTSRPQQAAAEIAAQAQAAAQQAQAQTQPTPSAPQSEPQVVTSGPQQAAAEIAAQAQAAAAERAPQVPDGPDTIITRTPVAEPEVVPSREPVVSPEPRSIGARYARLYGQMQTGNYDEAQIKHPTSDPLRDKASDAKLRADQSVVLSTLSKLEQLVAQQQQEAAGKTPAEHLSARLNAGVTAAQSSVGADFDYAAVPDSGILRDNRQSSGAATNATFNEESAKIAAATERARAFSVDAKPSEAPDEIASHASATDVKQTKEFLAAQAQEYRVAQDLAQEKEQAQQAAAKFIAEQEAEQEQLERKAAELALEQDLAEEQNEQALTALQEAQEAATAAVAQNAQAANTAPNSVTGAPSLLASQGSSILNPSASDKAGTASDFNRLYREAMQSEAQLRAQQRDAIDQTAKEYNAKVAGETLTLSKQRALEAQAVGSSQVNTVGDTNIRATGATIASATTNLTDAKLGATLTTPTTTTPAAQSPASPSTAAQGTPAQAAQSAASGTPTQAASTTTQAAPAQSTQAAPAAAQSTSPVSAGAQAVAQSTVNSAPQAGTTAVNEAVGPNALKVGATGSVSATGATGAMGATGAGAAPGAMGTVNVGSATPMGLDEDSLQDEIIRNVMRTVPSDDLDEFNLRAGQPLSGVIADTDLTAGPNVSAMPQAVATSFSALAQDPAPSTVVPNDHTVGAADIRAGQNAPIPEQSVVPSYEAPQEGGLLRRLASLFGRGSQSAENSPEIAQGQTASVAASALGNLKDTTADKSEMLHSLEQGRQEALRQNSLDQLFSRLNQAATNSQLPEPMQQQARKLLAALENPVNDLHTVSSWLNFVTGPLSPSSSLALALHQWAFMLLCIRFEQIGRSVDKFLKKQGKGNALGDNLAELEPAMRQAKDIAKGLDGSKSELTGGHHTSAQLLDDTLGQIERLQQQTQLTPPNQVLPRYIPLPPFYHGGKEGSLSAQHHTDEDGGKSWHLNFHFDLEHMGALEVKVKLRFPEVQISFVAERLDTLQRVQSLMPELNQHLAQMGLQSKGSNARLGHISPAAPAPSADSFRYEGATFTTKA